MTRIGSFTAIALLSLTTAAYPQYKSASYYCVAEFGGGIGFNPTTKQWAGGSFNVNNDKFKFTLRTTFLRRRNEEKLGGLQLDEYNILITSSNGTSPCFEGGSKVVSTPSDATAPAAFTMRCSTLFNEFVFNLKTKRFLQIYTVGYVDGDDTPHIAGGTCTNIE